MSKYKVLIIEDEENINNLLLRNAGMRSGQFLKPTDTEPFLQEPAVRVLCCFPPTVPTW